MPQPLSDELIALLQYGYRMSKSALNMAGATMAKDLQQSQVSDCDAVVGFADLLLVKTAVTSVFVVVAGLPRSAIMMPPAPRLAAAECPASCRCRFLWP